MMLLPCSADVNGLGLGTAMLVKSSMMTAEEI
jgi:hypothetical protein